MEIPDYIMSVIDCSLNDNVVRVDGKMIADTHGDIFHVRIETRFNGVVEGDIVDLYRNSDKYPEYLKDLVVALLDNRIIGVNIEEARYGMHGRIDTTDDGSITFSFVELDG